MVFPGVKVNVTRNVKRRSCERYGA